jgi:hypothetical protein
MIEPMARTAERMPKVIVSMEGESMEAELEKGCVVARVGRRSAVVEVEDMVHNVEDMEESTGMLYMDLINNGVNGSLICLVWSPLIALELC